MSKQSVCFAISLSNCDSRAYQISIFFLSFLSLSLHLPRFPAHFLHGSVISLFLQWIGFQLLSRAWRLLSPGFCHLSKTHCHFHSSSPSLPLYPLLLAPCLYLLQGRVVCVCVCVITILCSLIGLLRTSNIMETISANSRVVFFLPFPASPFYLSPSLSPPLFSALPLSLTSFPPCQTYCSISRRHGASYRKQVRMGVYVP